MPSEKYSWSLAGLRSVNASTAIDCCAGLVGPATSGVVGAGAGALSAGVAAVDGPGVPSFAGPRKYHTSTRPARTAAIA